MPIYLPIKILIIGNIRKDDSILLRKKFTGSKPYDETWYSFGCEFISGENPEETFTTYIKDYLDIVILPSKRLFWDAEIKEDRDGFKKQFVYLALEADYVSGEIQVPEELEKVEFVEINNLSNLDIVPPSINMFKRIGYLK